MTLINGSHVIFINERSFRRFLTFLCALLFCNRFIELNETEIKYSVKTDKNNAVFTRLILSCKRPLYPFAFN